MKNPFPHAPTLFALSKDGRLSIIINLFSNWLKVMIHLLLFSIEYKTMVAYCFLGQSPMWSPLFWYGRLFILGACPHLVYYFNLVAYLFLRPDKFLS